MLNYLLENYLPFYNYLELKDIRKLLMIHRECVTHLTAVEWEEIFKTHLKTKSVKINNESINIIHNKNHVTSIDKSINTNGKYLYEYLLQYQKI